MAAKQMSLTDDGHDAFSSQRLFGTLGMIGGPMLLAEAILYGLVFQSPNNRAVGVLELIYLGGWMASAVGMRQLRVTGKGWTGRAVFIVQMAGLLLAAAFSAHGLVQPNQELDTLFLKATDAAWPLSHLFMLVVGICVLKAGAWRGWRRLAPFLCGLGLPLFFAASALGARTLGGIIFPFLTMVGFVSLGYAVRTTRTR